MFLLSAVTNKKGAEKITAIYWFAVLLIVAGAIAYMVFIFYGKPYDIRGAEKNILTSQIADCLATGGYLNDEIISGLNNENFLERCNFNFETEEVYDWNDKGQFYAEINFYNFDSNLPEGYVGSVAFPKVVAGNSKLKPAFVYDGQTKDRIVIHYSVDNAARITESSLKKKNLGVQYILDKDGSILECEFYDKWKMKECYLRTDASQVTGVWEKMLAQHAGCGNHPKLCAEECITDAGVLSKDCWCSEGCCIPGFNQRSIGIEVVNWGCACGGSAKQYCGDEGFGIELEGNCPSKKNNCDGLSLWEEFTEEQMNSLIELVAGIVSRNNIPVDRDHIIGHEEITNMKYDPGPAFDWDRLIEGVKEITEESGSAEISNTHKLDRNSGRVFYVIDRTGKQYAIEIIAGVGKEEKNE